MRLLYTLSIIILFSVYATAQYSLHESIGHAPTAFSLQKGENRFTTTSFIINNYTRGITNNLSFSFGGIYLDGPIGVARLKYTHVLSNFVRIGISPIAGFDFYYDESFTEISGIITFGKSKRFFNISYTRAFHPDTELNNISMGFSFKLSNKFRLISENHLGFDSLPISKSFSTVNNLKLSWSFKERAQLQLGVYLFRECFTYYYDGGAYAKYCEVPTPYPIPTLSFSYFWGKKNVKKN